MKLVIERDGQIYHLKHCDACNDDWYMKPKANRCSICRGGLRRVREPEEEQLRALQRVLKEAK